MERQSVYPSLLETTSYLVVDKLSLQVPIMEVVGNSEPEIQEALTSGVAHLADTAEFGQIGNAYIVGHSSDYPWVQSSYKNIFAELPSLQIGEKVLINQGSEVLVYQIIKTQIVAADDLSMLSQNTSGKRLLTLQTSYPIGTAHQRFLVIAELVEK